MVLDFNFNTLEETSIESIIIFLMNNFEVEKLELKETFDVKDRHHYDCFSQHNT